LGIQFLSRPFWSWKPSDGAEPETTALEADPTVDVSKMMGEEVAKAEGELVVLVEGLFSLIIVGDGEAVACAALCDEHRDVEGSFSLIIPGVGEAVASAAWVGDPAYDVPVEFNGLFRRISDGEAVAFAAWDGVPVGDEVGVEVNDGLSPPEQSPADVGSKLESDEVLVGNEPSDVAVAVALLLPVCLAEAVGVEDSVLVLVEFDELLPLPTPGSDVISVS